MPQPLPSPPPLDPAQGVPGLRTLGTGHQQAAAGDDPRFTGAATAVTVLNVAALRALPAAPVVDSFYRTLGYSYSGTGVGLGAGAATYRWNSTSTVADDGALTIKITAVATGRFEFVMPDDQLFPLSCCSIDSTGGSHVGAALSTLAASLYAAGYSGMRGAPSAKYNLTASAYNLPTRTEWYPWKHVGIRFCGDNAAAGLTTVIAADVTVESGITGTGAVPVLAAGSIGPRTCTQTVYAGGRTFNGIADVRNLVVGDPVLVRCGADPTDGSGPWFTHHIARVVSITPTTGNAGNVVVDTHINETPIDPMPAYNINFIRVPTTQDMMKITGFQDNISFEDCEFNDVLVNCTFGRNFRVENPTSQSSAASFALFGTVAAKVTNPSYEKVIGLNTDAGDPTTDTFANYGWFIIANLTRDTEIRNLRIERLSAAIGICNSELQCRHTNFTGVTQVKFDVNQGGPYPLIGSFAETPNGSSIVKVDYFISDGGGGPLPPSVNTRFGTLVLGKNDAASGSANPAVPQYLFIRCNQVADVLVFRGNEYRTRKSCVVVCTGIAPSTTRTFPIPYNGLIRNIRVYASTLTGLTFWAVRGPGETTGSDQTINLAAGQWKDLQDPTLLSYQAQNLAADVQYIKITTNGSWPSTGYFVADIEVLQNNGSRDGLNTITDNSAVPYRVSSGAPSTSADFIEQENLDVTGSVWYKAVSQGSGAADWVRLGKGDGDMLKSDNLSGLANNATARTNLGLGTAATQASTAFQAADAELAAIAGLTSAADKVPYFTGSGTAALADFTAAGRALVDDADAAAQRATLGLVIGTNVQAQDAELAAIAGLTSAADKVPYFTGSGTAALATVTSVARNLLDDPDTATQQATLGLQNSSTSNGRIEAPVQIDRQTLSGATSYTSPSFTAETYKELILKADGTDSTAAFANLSLTGLTGTPNSYIITNGSAQDNRGVAATIWVFNGAAAADLRVETHIFPLNTGRRRKFLTRGVSISSDSRWLNEGGGDFPDTTNGVTAVTLALSGFTGTIELFGIPV